MTFLKQLGIRHFLAFLWAADAHLSASAVRLPPPPKPLRDTLPRPAFVGAILPKVYTLLQLLLRGLTPTLTPAEGQALVWDQCEAHCPPTQSGKCDERSARDALSVPDQVPGTLTQWPFK